MTREELDAYYATPGGKAFIDAAPSTGLDGFISPAAFNDKLEAAKKPLIEKRDALLTEAKNAKEAKRELEKELENGTRFLHLLEDHTFGLDESGKLSYSKVEELLRQIRSGKDPALSGASDAELLEVRRSLNKSQREMETKLREMESLQNELNNSSEDINVRDEFIHTLLIDQKMRSALSAAGYPEATIKMIIPSLVKQSGALVHYDDSIEEIGQRWSAITNDNQTIEDYVKWWSTTEEGLHFMPGRRNSGGGAGGSNGGGGSKSWSEMTPTEKTNLYKKDPEAYRQLRTAARSGNS